MEWEYSVIEALQRTDIDLVAYLPDSALSDLIDRVEELDGIDTVLLSREEEAVGILSGAWLTGRRGALICQSSGLANTFNALGSLSKPTRLPFLGIVTHRGDLGDHNLAHTAAEYPMPELLNTIGIRNHCLHDGVDVEQRVTMAAKTAFSQEEPYVMLLEPTLLEGDE